MHTSEISQSILRNIMDFIMKLKLSPLQKKTTTNKQKYPPKKTAKTPIKLQWINSGQSMLYQLKHDTG